MTLPPFRRLFTGLPVIYLLLLAPIIGFIATQNFLVAVVGSAGLVAGIFVLTIAKQSVFRDVVLAVCALVIVYPAIVPRPNLTQQSAVQGGEVDSRGKVLLAVVLVIAVAAIWFWLSHSGSLAVFTEPPMSLFGWYCAAIVISLTYTPALDWALVAALKLFEVILLMAALTVVLKTEVDLKRLIDAILGALAFVFVVYWYDKLSGATAGTSDARFTSVWLHPTRAAILAFSFTAIAGARFYLAKSPRDTVITGAIFGYGAMSGLMTGGKSGAIAGGVALLLTIVVVVLRRPSVGLFDRLAMTAIGLAMIGTYFIASGQGLAGQVTAYQQNQHLESSNLTGRVPLWQMTFPRAMQEPIIGHGYMSGFVLGMPNGHGWVTGAAHNSFLTTLFDLGVMGLIPALAIYFSAWKRVLTQVITADRNTMHWERSVELFAALIVVTIVSFVEDIWGGIFDVHTMVFVVVIFSIFQNDRINRWRLRQQRDGNGHLAPRIIIDPN